MNINEGIPKTIEKERERYIVSKLKEMLEDAFYTRVTEIPEIKKVEIEKFDSAEELLEELRRLFPHLGKEIDLWYQIRELTTLVEVEKFWQDNIGITDLKNIENDLGNEFDTVLKNIKK